MDILATDSRSSPAREPRTFRDARGDVWRFQLTVGDLWRLRDEHGVDYVNVVASNAFAELLDAARLVDVCYLLLADQRQQRGIDTPLDFAYRFGTDVLDDAYDALAEGLIFFSPRSIRPALQEMLEAVKRARATTVELTAAKTRSHDLTPRLQAAIDTAFRDALGNPPPSTSGSTN